jgi:peptidyl-prolyl isomerase E (cyclophilin E)
MAFMPFGEIAQVVMPTETGTQKHKGFAFVEFDLAEDAEHALFNMNNAELYGRVLKLSYAKPQALARNKAIWEVLEADTAGPQEGDGAEDQAQVDV